jgi:hypothetical protein
VIKNINYKEKRNPFPSIARFDAVSLTISSLVKLRGIITSKFIQWCEQIYKD